MNSVDELADFNHQENQDQPQPSLREPQSLVVTVAEAAELLRLDKRTVRHLFATGALEGNRIGHAIRLSRTSIVEWARGRRRVSRSRGSR